MKRGLVFIGMFVAGVLLVQPQSIAKAQDIGIGSGGYAQQIGSKAGYDTAQTATSLSERVGQIIKIVLSLMGTIFLALTIYAGVIWMTASGNEEKVEQATKILKAATIGLIIVISGYALTTFVVGRLVQSSGVSSKVGGTPPVSKGFWQDWAQGVKDRWNTFWTGTP